MGFKKWFRGANDSTPDVEKEEVDLAQAIIDLHKIDPKTGEVVDITEDEDKAAEIRKVIGEISGKLDEEEIQKLTDALTGLAYNKATGDEDPERGASMNEDLKKAMDDCGLDSEDETAQAAFAEGVKYGEKLEKDPAERQKLDREHESEGMKRVMDACGIDSENPQETAAFSEGVKYGEKTALAKGKDDDLAEAEDEDKNAEITKILNEVPGLTDEQKKQLEASLQDLAYSKATGDEDKTAQDSALKRRKVLFAHDAKVTAPFSLPGLPSFASQPPQ